MRDDEFTTKVSYIMETDGLLRDYIHSVVLKKIKDTITDDEFTRLSSNHIHAALLLKRIAPCALKEFATAMRLSKSAASAMVDRMVENKLIMRKQNPNNRREIIVTVSPEFDTHVTYVRNELVKWFASMVQDLGPHSFDQWYSVMTQVNESLRQQMHNPEP